MIASHSPRRRTIVVAKCPSTGVIIRGATADEAWVYRAFNARRRGTASPVRVGAVIVDTYSGPGVWHGGPRL